MRRSTPPKLLFDPNEPLHAMVDPIAALIGEGRSGRESATRSGDQGVPPPARLPCCAPASVSCAGWTRGDLLPGSFSKGDPLYASSSSPTWAASASTPRITTFTSTARSPSRHDRTAATACHSCSPTAPSPAARCGAALHLR
jgi:hypothetical protein